MSKKIGIIREIKHEGERRIPLTPRQLNALQESNTDVRFVVDPSPARAFKRHEFESKGVAVSDDLSECSIVLGVKEIPVGFIEANKVYVFFSHTIKGQSYNMPMLRHILDVKATLIDYELIKDAEGRRLVFFGHYAGMAGMIETLWALGRRLRAEGVESPFARLKRAADYGHHENAQKAILGIREKLEKFLPSQKPMIFGFAGYGNVSKGAQQIFDSLPHVEIAPPDIRETAKQQSPNTVFKVVFKEEHLFEPCDPNKGFELDEYYEHPERYMSVFKNYLRFLTVLMNCIYWDERYPRLITKEDIRALYAGKPLLKVIGDITCDIGGAIECTMEATTVNDPVYVYFPEKDDIIWGFEGKGPVIMAVDNLPAGLPRESSEAFGESLMPFISDLAACDFSESYEKLALPMELNNAVIAHKGELTPDFEYLYESLDEWPGV